MTSALDEIPRVCGQSARLILRISRRFTVRRTPEGGIEFEALLSRSHTSAWIRATREVERDYRRQMQLGRVPALPTEDDAVWFLLTGWELVDRALDALGSDEPNVFDLRDL